MAFEWNSLGPAPAPEEFEVSVFGPGFGECIVVHAGQGRWFIVDSCVESDSVEKLPVAERYLRGLGVDLRSQVDLIVATHWHADHIRGLGRLVEQCPSAQFSCANALLRDEFVTYVEAMYTGAAATNGAKLADFREALRVMRERGQSIRYATGNRLLKRWAFKDVDSREEIGSCSLTSLSPSDHEFELFLQHVAEILPQHGQPKRAATTQTPNLASVVLHLQHSEFSLLLGADMEVHNNPRRGWTAALNEAIDAGLPPSDFIKIPHHGSLTGHHEGVWAQLCVQRPAAVVTPFNRLPEARKLPTAADIARMVPLCSRLDATATIERAAASKRDKSVERSLKESGIEIRPLGSPLGLVRSRRQSGEGWTTQVFAPAVTLSEG